MGRISRAQMFMQMARVASLRSTCHRLNVGAIVTQGNNPVAVGWNGQEPGAPHCAGNDCPGIIPGKCGTIHAEKNAILKAERVLERVANFNYHRPEVDLYCTDSPCGECVELVMRGTDLRIKRLFYETPYRDTSHLGQLHGVTEVYLVTPAGYVIDHFTRKVVEVP